MDVVFVRGIINSRYSATAPASYKIHETRFQCCRAPLSITDSTKQSFIQLDRVMDYKGRDLEPGSAAFILSGKNIRMNNICYDNCISSGQSCARCSSLKHSLLNINAVLNQDTYDSFQIGSNSMRVEKLNVSRHVNPHNPVTLIPQNPAEKSISLSDLFLQNISNGGNDSNSLNEGVISLSYDVTFSSTYQFEGLIVLDVKSIYGFCLNAFQENDSLIIGNAYLKGNNFQQFARKTKSITITESYSDIVFPDFPGLVQTPKELVIPEILKCGDISFGYQSKKRTVWRLFLAHVYQ